MLVRVPLGWASGAGDMCAVANGKKACDIAPDPAYAAKQTFEIRSADGSADIYMLLAGLAVAVRHGFELSEPLEVAARYYVDVDIHKPENAARLASLPTLPTGCRASAKCLLEAAPVFEEYGVFSRSMIDGVVKRLESFDGSKAAEALDDSMLMLEMVREFFYCG